MAHLHDGTEDGYIYHGEAWDVEKMGKGERFYMFLIERGKYEEVAPAHHGYYGIEPPEFEFVPYEAIYVRPRLKYPKRDVKQ